MPKIQTILGLILTALVFLTWGAIFRQHQLMTHAPMSDMWMPPAETSDWSPIDFGTVFVMWAVMMVAMMLPSAAPLVLAFDRICRRRGQSPFSSTLAFLFGYLSLWFCFSSVLTLLQWQMHGLFWLSPSMDNKNRNLAMAIFILAAAYQLLPLKHACLTRCQSPLGFLLNHWQYGAVGALTMGARHGLTCLGCCWAEMLLMFAVGVMNLTGMVVITLLITLEKFSPLGPRITSCIGALIFGVWAAFLFIV